MGCEQQGLHGMDPQPYDCCTQSDSDDGSSGFPRMAEVSNQDQSVSWHLMLQFSAFLREDEAAADADGPVAGGHMKLSTFDPKNHGNCVPLQFDTVGAFETSGLPRCVCPRSLSQEIDKQTAGQRDRQIDKWIDP